nr:umecyanin-like [Ziziphus jujuba var. spinosa]
MIILVGVAMAAPVLVQPSSQARGHMVGGSITWIIPPAGASSFASWNAHHSFSVMFNFVTGGDDVALISKKDFDAFDDTYRSIVVHDHWTCIVQNQICWQLFFISTVANHCAAGQKLAIHSSG